MYRVGILIFEEVEVLDFSGPFEVFSLAENNDRMKLCQVFLVSEKIIPVQARNELLCITKF